MPVAPSNAVAFAATYIALLAILGLVLTFRVIAIRRSAKIGIGDGDNRELARRIRVHGNFCETAPLLGLVLIMLVLLGAKEWLVHAIGLSGLVGRILHAIGLSQSAGTTFGRFAGMLTTILSIACGALALLVLAWR